jgi:hypothetical protein
MRVLGWNIHWGRRRCEPATSFPRALTKVRSLRERCQWPPLSRESAIQQRESRVMTARTGVHYSGLPADLPIHVPRKPKLLWLCNVHPLYVLAALCVVAALAAFFLLVLSRDPARAEIYTLPEAPVFLSEELALAKAQETIRSNVKPVTNQLWTTAPDGRRDVYLWRSSPYAGTLTFVSNKGLNQHLWVNLLLESNRLSCAVQRLR